MKRLFPIGVLLAFMSVPVLAGGYFMNDTGETAYGLRVEFSEPVTITSFGDLLTVIDLPGESTTFTFSGGTVEPWGDHWIIWEPASASIVSEEWLATPPSVEIPEAVERNLHAALAHGLGDLVQMVPDVVQIQHGASRDSRATGAF